MESTIPLIKLCINGLWMSHERNVPVSGHIIRESFWFCERTRHNKFQGFRRMARSAGKLTIKCRRVIAPWDVSLPGFCPLPHPTPPHPLTLSRQAPPLLENLEIIFFKKGFFRLTFYEGWRLNKHSKTLKTSRHTQSRHGTQYYVKGMGAH